MTTTMSCRFYKNTLPEVEELVMVHVHQIEEMGVFVHLLEYNDHQGMILMTELSRRRIRSINKLIRVGRNEVVVVVRVDRDKGYIDLSKRQVMPEEQQKCEERYARGKTVHSILRHTAELLGLTTDAEFEELYEKTAWFYDEKFKRRGAAFDVFLRAVSDEHVFDDCPIDEQTKELLMNNIRRRLAPHAVKCRTDVEVACYEYEGVDAVKAALREGLTVSTDDMPVKINLIAPPLYVVTTTCLDSNAGIAVLKEASSRIEESIKQYRGRFKVKMEPKVVTHQDEEELRDLLIEKELEVTERPGDDDDDEDDDVEPDDNDEDADVSRATTTLRTVNISAPDDDEAEE